MTRQLTDRPPAVVDAGQALRRRAKWSRGPRWSGRKRRDFFVFLALALPNLVLIGVFTHLRPTAKKRRGVPVKMPLVGKGPWKKLAPSDGTQHWRALIIG
jgi:hypothetical protein